MYNQQYYIIVNHCDEKYVHGPFNSDDADFRVQIIKKRYEYDNLNVVTEGEYYELEREEILKDGAVD